MDFDPTKQLAAETRALAVFASVVLHRILDPGLGVQGIGAFPPEMLEDLLRAMKRVESDRWRKVEAKKGNVSLADHYEKSEWLIEVRMLMARWSADITPLIVQLVPRDRYAAPDPSYEALRVAVARFLRHTLHNELGEFYDLIKDRYTLIVDAPAWAFVF